MEYFLDMDVDDFIPQFIHSKENELKEKLWVMYSNMFPNFNKDNFLNFEQFCDKFTGRNQTENNKRISSNGKTYEELVAEAENILFKMEFVEKQ